jgi:class 3 adenylate cyclase
VNELRYAKNDGLHLAYQTISEGALDILTFTSALISIESIDAEPRFARFHRRLGSFGRLTRFDYRGIGLSDAPPRDATLTTDDLVADAIAVMDAAGIERAAVFAPSDSSVLGIHLAATHPERVSSLIIVNGTARYAYDDDHQFGIPRAVLDQFLETQLVPTAAPDFSFLEVSGPSVAQDTDFRDWWIRAGSRGASPGRAQAMQAVLLRADMRPLLPAVEAPTLVLQRRSDRVVNVGHGRLLGDRIPRAKLVELEGKDNMYWVGDTTSLLDEVEEFLTGVRSGAGTERMLTTIVFTDIVGSTENAASLGDRRWRELLDSHDAALRQQLVTYGGREVNTTGDGIVAAFDGPTRAVTCAIALVDAAARAGVQIRVGIHTGEVERRGNDLAGLAVHLAARVEAQAGAGEVLVSRTVVDLVAGSGIRFTDRGEHALKGVPGTWQLYVVER